MTRPFFVDFFVCLFSGAHVSRDQNIKTKVMNQNPINSRNTPKKEMERKANDNKLQIELWNTVEPG